MNEQSSDLPQAENADPDGVQLALRAAHTLWSRGDTTESLKWLRKAAESASDEGADVRSFQLAKAAAELRARLFGSSEPPRPSSNEISGAHPIAQPHSMHQPNHLAEPEAMRAAGSMSSSMTPPMSPQRSPSSPPPADAFGHGATGFDEPEEVPVHHPSSHPVVTATQYPSHRPRQRMGLTSTSHGLPPSNGPQLHGGQLHGGQLHGGQLHGTQPHGTQPHTVPSNGLQSGYAASPAQSGYASAAQGGYASVPSWSADSERRSSSAPPPLPHSASHTASLDDYEELEAEPDEEPVDDPGSVWSSGSTDSWRPPEATDGNAEPWHPSATAPAVLPPPLPLHGAFAEDAVDYNHLPDPPTVVIPSAEDEADPRSSRRQAASYSVPGGSWDQQSRAPAWDQDTGSSTWAEELRNATWGSTVNLGAATPEPGASPEPPPPSDTAPAKLTARVHHQAVRVSFAPDLRVPGQFVVRPLREGEKAATGERIALLVALEPGTPLV